MSYDPSHPMPPRQERWPTATPAEGWPSYRDGEQEDPGYGRHGATAGYRHQATVATAAYPAVANGYDTGGYDTGRTANGYRADGYTGTLLDHLPHYYAARNAGVGALVVYGPGTGHHVAMVREPGSDPLLFSHGDETGPHWYRLSQERTWQPPPVTFLAISAL